MIALPLAVDIRRNGILGYLRGQIYRQKSYFCFIVVVLIQKTNQFPKVLHFWYRFPNVFVLRVNHSRILNSRDLIDSSLLTLWRKLRCCENLSTCTICYYCYLHILATSLFSRPPTYFLWYLTPARISGKFHEPCIISAFRVSKRSYSPSAKLEKT